MKIPNTENKKNVIYIQLKDLYAIIEIKENIPEEIKTIIESSINVTLKENDFIRIENSQVIDFINSIDWILNYKEFVKCKDYEIEYQYMRTHQRLALFKPATERIPEDYCSIQEYKKSNHKMNDIKQAIQSIVYNNVDIPLIEDSEADKYYIKNHNDYRIQASLNPNIFIIRKLNLTLASLEDIPYDELKDFISLIKKEECEIDLSINQTDPTAIICAPTPIPVKQETKPVQKRNFFKRKKNKRNTI